MYQFGDNKQTVKRSRAITGKLITEANEIAQKPGGVEVLGEYEQIFPVLFGWWRFAARTAEAVFYMEAGGFSVEAAPLMRNLIGHTYASIWLADNGIAALRALREYSVAEHNKLLRELRKQNWKAATGIVDEPEPVFDLSNTERSRHRTLVGEIQNFSNLVTAYGTPAMYQVYRHLSGYSHTTITTAMSYLHQSDDGALTLRDVPADSGSRPDIIWTPVCLIQAGNAISPMIKGEPLRKVLDKAAHDLGLPTDYQPHRTKTLE